MLAEPLAETDPGLGNGTNKPAVKITWGFSNKSKIRVIDGESRGFIELVGGYDNELDGRFLGGGFTHVIQNLRHYYGYEGAGFDVFRDCFGSLLIIIESLNPRDPTTPYKLFFLRHQLRRLANEFYLYYHERFRIEKVNYREYPVSKNDRKPSRYMRNRRAGLNA